MPILMRYNPHRKKKFNIPITGNKPRKTVYKEHKALLRDAIQSIPTSLTNEEYVRRRQRLEVTICALRDVYKAGKGEKMINIDEDIFLSCVRIIAAGHDNADDDLKDDLTTLKEFKRYAMQEAEVDPRVANRADAVRNAAIVRMDSGTNNTEAQAALCIRIRNTAKQLRGVTAPPPDNDNQISIFPRLRSGGMITAAPNTRIRTTQRATGFFAIVSTGYAGRRYSGYGKPPPHVTRFYGMFCKECRKKEKIVKKYTNGYK